MFSLLSMKRLFLFSTIFFFLFLTRDVFAAELYLSPSSGQYKVGDTIKVRIVLSSSSQSANAVSSNLSFSKNLLTLTSVSKTDSLVSLWAQEPTYSNANGTANMEGVILSGYSGSNGTIITLFFKAKATGSADVEFTSSSVLANDGLGTNILTGTRQANFNISQGIASAPTKEKTTPNVQVQELKKKDEFDSFLRFLITGIGKKTGSSYKVEIDGIESKWDNQSSGIFETPPLAKGPHILKVSMDTTDGDNISNSLPFTISTILIPAFTEYSENIKEKEYIVARGLADPNIDITINSKALLMKTGEILVQEINIKSDDKGLFTYVSEKAEAGVYEMTAYSRTKKGNDSEKSLPIKINVLSKTTPITTSIMNTFSFLIPILALIVLLLLLAIWGWYKVLHYRESMRKKLLHTKSLVSKSFHILDDDIEEQIRVLKKVKGLQPLTQDEKAFIHQFKKDIESAEQVILNEIKEDEK